MSFTCKTGHVSCGPSAEWKHGPFSKPSESQDDGSRALNRAWGPPERAHEASPAGWELVTATLPHWGLTRPVADLLQMRKPRLGRLRVCQRPSAGEPCSICHLSAPGRSGSLLPLESQQLSISRWGLGSHGNQLPGWLLGAPGPHQLRPPITPPPPRVPRVDGVGILPLCEAVQPGNFPFASVGTLQNVLVVAQGPSLSEKACLQNWGCAGLGFFSPQVNSMARNMHGAEFLLAP